MKANEYINKYGVDCANEILKHNQDLMNIGFFINLKRLVESHELVESKGGLAKAKEILADNPVWCFGSKRYSSPLEEAIADVEGCMESGK